jgi:hypothetical protein
MSAHTATPSITLKTPQSPPAKSNSKTADTIFCEFLKPEEYREWDGLVDRSVHGTVFHYSWWLQATSSDFQLLVVRDHSSRILGGIPLPNKRASLLRLYHSPLLTPYLGPIFDLTGIGNNYDKLYAMRSHGELLARHMPVFDSFRYIAGASAPDLQGFLWAGFGVQLAYTFRFSAASSLDEIAKAMSRTHAQKLSKAKKLHLQVNKENDIEQLIALNAMIFAKQNQKPPYSPDFIKKVWSESSSRNRGRLYIARTPEGVPVAGLFTVNDDRTTFQIISGINTSMPDVPGGNLCLWTAIQDAVQEGRDFDFEGSSLRGVEVFYRRWGAAAVPVWRIEKTGSLQGVLAQALIQRRDAASRQPSPAGVSSTASHLTPSS